MKRDLQKRPILHEKASVDVRGKDSCKPRALGSW